MKGMACSCSKHCPPAAWQMQPQNVSAVPAHSFIIAHEQGLQDALCNAIQYHMHLTGCCMCSTMSASASSWWCWTNFVSAAGAPAMDELCVAEPLQASHCLAAAALRLAAGVSKAQRVKAIVTRKPATAGAAAAAAATVELSHSKS
jgi:hypothetical protein